MLLTPWYPFPTLTTERLVLRQMNDGDLQDFFDLRSDINIMRHIDRPLHITLDDTRALMKTADELYTSGNGINWGITVKGSSKIIGTIGYYRMQKEHFRAEIGYLLSPDYQRKKIMSEAMQPVIAYGFNEMKAHTIFADVNPNNIASCTLLEKNGFVKEAHFKENYYHDGHFHDTFIYTIWDPSSRLAEK